MASPLVLAACKNEDAEAGSELAEQTTKKTEISSDLIHGQPLVTDDQGLVGRALAIRHCQRCHSFVEPDALPKAVWQNYALPRMGAFMGMHYLGVKTIVESGPHPAEAQIVHDAGVYAPAAEMPLEDWRVLVAYFVDHAPESLGEPDGLVAIAPSSGRFVEAVFGYREREPTTTLVKIDEGGKRLFVGDMVSSKLSVLGADLNRSQKIDMPSAPVHAEILNGDLWVTTIGYVNPSDFPGGQLAVFKGEGGYFATSGQQKLAGLRRPTHASYADINKDGVTDVLMSEYGNQIGAFTYYQAGAGGAYSKVEVIKEPGSMTSHVHDFNNDGWLDVAVVYGQNREGVHIYYNRGDGSFTMSYALPLPPTYGSASIAFYDFNSDGYLDVLATNGDNGDYPAILKPHHGVRIYLNSRNNAFEESYFFPMNGAFQALAEDFDLDGDLDIAAVSMFPDFVGRPEEGFVYLENDGGLSFKASTIERVKDGRWLCMDTGDLDGDGDKDIVIGSFIRGPSAVPPSLVRSWEDGALPGLVLWNKTR